MSGGLKILGYLEDPAAVPTLLAFARDAKQPPAVREEAIVALRFTARGKAAPVATALAELAERATPELARAALYSLASLELPPAIAPRLQKIALGREPERALLAIERLAQIPAPRAATASAPCCHRPPIAGAPRPPPRRSARGPTVRWRSDARWRPPNPTATTMGASPCWRACCGRRRTRWSKKVPAPPGRSWRARW